MTRSSTGLALCLMISLGCQPAPPPLPTSPSPTLGPPILQITPTAAALLKQRQLILGVPDPCWVRISMPATVRPTDPPYQFEFLTLGSASSDYAFEAGGILCLVPREQVGTLTDTLIDTEAHDEVVGFLISNPRFNGGQPLWLSTRD